MRYLTLGALVCACVSLGSIAQAQTADPQVMAPVNKFMEAFNKGDTAGAAATHAPDADLVIIDEVAPYLWRGAQAFQTWAADLDRDEKKRGVSDQKVSIGAVKRFESDGTSAYIVVPSTYTFKEKGVAMRETAQMTFTLKKGANGWLIHGWTWTGPRAQKLSGTAGK
ncbi:MAG TPA: nuclear transport factor 2 family protein [Vicinamibacterales bacterium]